jgi:mono/diheme cytochrome c family protein
MRRILKTAGYAGGALLALLFLGAFTVFGVSSSKLGQTFPTDAAAVAIPDDAESLAWGRYLVEAVGGCQDCHGMDLAGQTMMEPSPVGFLASTNLTGGAGGIGRDFATEDWVRAIRHGVRRDGTSLYVMPSYAYAHLSDRDLGAMIAYLRTLPPVDREQPPPKLGPLGRVLLTAGQLDFMVAEKTPRFDAYDGVERTVSAEYGGYLANVSGCTSCHRPDLTGGPAGPPEAPPAANINPHGLAGWSEPDFFRAMRDGRRPDGSEISEYMPWRFTGRMTDDELRALWLYLQSVPPRETPAS